MFLDAGVKWLIAMDFPVLDARRRNPASGLCGVTSGRPAHQVGAGRIVSGCGFLTNVSSVAAELEAGDAEFWHGRAGPAARGCMVWRPDRA